MSYIDSRSTTLTAEEKQAVFEKLDKIDAATAKLSNLPAVLQIMMENFGLDIYRKDEDDLYNLLNRNELITDTLNLVIDTINYVIAQLNKEQGEIVQTIYGKK